MTTGVQCIKELTNKGKIVNVWSHACLCVRVQLQAAVGSLMWQGHQSWYEVTHCSGYQGDMWVSSCVCDAWLLGTSNRVGGCLCACLGDLTVLLFVSVWKKTLVMAPREAFLDMLSSHSIPFLACCWNWHQYFLDWTGSQPKHEKDTDARNLELNSIVLKTVHITKIPHYKWWNALI